MNVFERSGTARRCCTYVRQTLRFHSLGGSTAHSYMKSRRGHHLEIMTSNRKSDSVSGCVLTMVFM